MADPERTSAEIYAESRAAPDNGSVMSPSTRLHAAEYSVRHYDGEMHAHQHAHVQILYALQGRMELEVDGRAAFVDTASGIVIPAGAVHRYLAQPGSAIAVVDTPDHPQLTRLQRFAAPPPKMRAIHGSPYALAAAHLAWLQQAPQLLPRRQLDVQAIARAVQADLAGDWPTSRLATLAHMSAQRFHVRWQELTGATPQHWLRSLRLDAAATALSRGEPLETTALRCGYRSASALAYALRRDRGTGARELRK